MQSSRYTRSYVGLLLPVLTGCMGSLRPVESDQLWVRQHAIFVDRDGAALRIRARGDSTVAKPDQLSAEEYREQLARITGAIAMSGRRRTETKQAHMRAGNGFECSADGRRVLVFVHGGMNYYKGSLQRTLEKTQEICDAGLYPIFVNWHSGLLGSYAEHLFFLREGERQGKFSPLFPIVIATDAVRGVAYLPTALVRQGRNAWQSQSWGHTRAEAISDSILHHQARPGAIATSLGRYKKPVSEQVGRGIALLLTLPTKIVGAVAVEAVGTPAWNVMLRRTHNMYRRPDEYSPTDSSGAAYVRPTGAIALLFAALDSLTRSPSDSISREIIVVGHSMGSIVLNAALREHPNLPVKSIVYMAAACSVRDWQENVLPFLASHRAYGTQFYNLTLHPKAEISETDAGDIGPRGSLLTWIDEIFATPETPMDKTLGTYDNAVRSLQIVPDSVRAQVHLKGFGYHDRAAAPSGKERYQPAKHGDFGNLQFWSADVWAEPSPSGALGRGTH